MAQIRVIINEASGEVQVFTDATEGDLDYLGGKAATEEFFARLGAKLGVDGIRLTTGVEQHKAESGGGSHAHLHHRTGQGGR